MEKQMVKSYKELLVWQKSIALSKQIYGITELFPKSEIYGLSLQMRRSAISVASNIAEGNRRNSTKEFIRFLSMSLGSLGELETQIIIAKEVGFLSIDTQQQLEELTDHIGRMLVQLQRSLARKL